MRPRGRRWRGRSEALRVAAALAAWMFGCTEGGGPQAGVGAPTEAICPEESSLSYATFGEAFLQEYCVECHSSDLPPESRQGAPLSYDYDRLENLLRAGAQQVDSVAAAGPSQLNDYMPPATYAKRPTAAERRQLGEWLACGAP